jgi:hypothetical protein
MGPRDHASERARALLELTKAVYADATAAYPQVISGRKDQEQACRLG